MASSVNSERRAMHCCGLYGVGVLILIGLAAAAVPSARADSIVNSPHNLSVTGPGPVRSTVEVKICIFCHTPHHSRSGTPLWNRADSSSVYLSYESDTLDATVGQPSGSSMLCLSCHDGTIALGAVLSELTEIPMEAGHQFITGRPALGTDLRDDHPISFPYDSALVAGSELKPEALIPADVHLDGQGNVQCTSCHDPHDNGFGAFLSMTTQNSILCLACHDPTGWAGSSHSSSTATWGGAGTDPWPHTDWLTVAENGCLNCHDVHGGGGTKYLLGDIAEEQNCLVCHDGSISQLDIAALLTEFTVHPVSDTQGVHSVTEDYLSMTWHVECTDCHNPHQAQSGTATAPSIPPSMMGARGVTLSGSEILPAVNAYEVCFRCHGDSAQSPIRIPRQVVSNNTRLEFALTNSSFHPVAGPRNNPDVPSLTSGYTSSSVIYCHDCHGNPDGQMLGGNGPDGPHGSPFHSLLSDEYVTTDPWQESSAAYALCYRCHSQASILNDDSFKEHDKHVSKEDAPCSVCHDPHGIDAGSAPANEHTNLINFDTSVVEADPDTGLLKFEDLGQFTGRCYLLCHGEKHSPKEY